MIERTIAAGTPARGLTPDLPMLHPLHPLPPSAAPARRRHRRGRAALFAASLLAGGCASHEVPRDWRHAIKDEAWAKGAPEPSGPGVKPGEALVEYVDVDLPQKVDPATAAAEESLKSPYDRPPKPLGVREAVAQTLEHNLQLQIQGYQLRIAQMEIPLQKGIYDLLLQSSSQARLDDAQTGSVGDPTSSIKSQGLVNSASLTQLFSGGALVALGYNLNYLHQDFSSPTLFNPFIQQGLALSIKQPLLRGAGPNITNVNIHIAQVGSKISALDFRTAAVEQTRRTLLLYWDLALRTHQYRIDLASYLGALELARINRRMAEEGIVLKTEAMQAEARAGARRETLVEARARLRETEDLMKQSLAFKENSPAWSEQLLPTEPLKLREYAIDEEKVLAEAYAARPELHIREARLDRNDLQIERAQNELLPDVGVVASVGITGGGEGVGDSLGRLAGSDFNNVAVGLQLSHPLQNRRAYYQHQQALTERDVLLKDYMQQRNQVTFDVRKAVRDLAAARERIQIASVRVANERANLDAEQRRYQAGFSTSFQVLEFQEFLANAQSALLQATVEYRRGLVELERAKGTLLETYGIELDLDDGDPRSDTLAIDHERANLWRDRLKRMMSGRGEKPAAPAVPEPPAPEAAEPPDVAPGAGAAQPTPPPAVAPAAIPESGAGGPS